MLKSRFAAIAVLALSAALLLSACGEKTISKSTVEKQIKTKFAPVAKITSVSCPDDLEAKVGKKETCTITSGGKKYKTTATITKVSGDTGYFNLSAPVAA
jgi:ABC-type oligopeptide transport system substrate-binding subunit